MSPRTPKQFAEIRDEKRNLIMDVALEHFSSKGYFVTTMSHIAKHAEISKGLIYNYFESKEALLKEIIHRSVQEAYLYFDLDNDGYLSEDEFDFFVRRISLMYKEKKTFWRLFTQLMMQDEVRDLFQKLYIDQGGGDHAVSEIKPGFSVTDIIKMLSDYFMRKKERKGPDYDPYLDMNMFIISMKGFAITYIYTDENDDVYYEKTINRIIELYK
jgi:AcrR family transcriptional regulator